MLDKYRGPVFPERFYDFQWPFHCELAAAMPRLTLEQRVAR